MVDAQGRPYFLCDCELTADDLRRHLLEGDRATRAYLVGKLMRQAKPDDVFLFVSLEEIRDLWPDLERYLGLTRPFWSWLLPRWEETLLAGGGLEVQVLQESPAFYRMRVSAGAETTIVDLVAEAAAPIEAPLEHHFGGSAVMVDTPHEILVNKLCALLGRAELRDLQDVGALLDAGGELERAVGDASRKDGGFSPVTLAWVLEGLDLATLGKVAGLAGEALQGLDRLRVELITRLLALSRPG